jgi:hypothetical protein
VASSVLHLVDKRVGIVIEELVQVATHIVHQLIHQLVTDSAQAQSQSRQAKHSKQIIIRQKYTSTQAQTITIKWPMVVSQNEESMIDVHSNVDSYSQRSLDSSEGCLVQTTPITTPTMHTTHLSATSAKDSPRARKAISFT